MILPDAEGAEKSVISSMLRKPSMLARGRAEGIAPDHFHGPGRKALYEAMLARTAAGHDLELVSFVQWLKDEGLLEAIGGPGAITDVYSYAPNDEHFGSHVAILREKLGQRIALANAATIMEGDASAEDLAMALRRASDATRAALSADNGLITAKEAIRRLMASMEAAKNNGDMPGMATGLDPVDLVTGGMRGGDLWVFAGPPGGGKTAGMIQIAGAFLARGAKVLIVSLEMKAETVVMRLASAMYGIKFRHLTHPREASHLSVVTAERAFKEISVMPLAIHDKGGMDIERVMGVARMLKDSTGLDLLVLDYIQRLAARGRGHESREQEVASMSRGLKEIAMELDIPVLTGSQLNDNGRLRESRAIGQDADVVLVIEDQGIEGRKVRNGTPDQIFPLVFNGELQRFERR